MSDYQVKTSHQFDNDIDRIQRYLSQGNYYESTIKEIFETIYQDLVRLRSSPRIGAKLSNKTSIENDYRYIVSGEYLIFYKIFENEKIVRVYHVYHGRDNYLVKLNLN